MGTPENSKVTLLEKKYAIEGAGLLPDTLRKEIFSYTAFDIYELDRLFESLPQHQQQVETIVADPPPIMQEAEPVEEAPVILPVKEVSKEELAKEYPPVKKGKKRK